MDNGTLYECPCLDGFFKIFDTDKSCHDMNECIPIETDHDHHNCDKHAKCTNNFGNFACKCNDGWKGDGVTCENIGAFIGFFYRVHIRVHQQMAELLHSNVSLYV